MILYYANGGGLGHLKRTSAVIHTLQLNPKKIILLTASQYYSEDYLPNLHKVILIPIHFANDLKNYRKWLKEVIEQHAIKDIFLDVFPAGLIGEWQDIESWLPTPHPRFYLIARLLNWKHYQRIIINKTVIFQKIYAVENLNDEWKNYLKSYKVINLSLSYPQFELNESEKAIYQEFQKENYGLIIHSKPINELEILVEQAKNTVELMKTDLKWIIISTIESYVEEKKYTLLHSYQPEKYIKKAKLVFTAGGFNSIELAKKDPSKYFIIPFDRFYDLQFVRVAYWRKKYKNISQFPQ